MNSLTEQFLSVHRSIPLTDKKTIQIIISITTFLANKLKGKNNMLTKHAIIWSIFTQICYFVAWKGSTVLACCIKIVHKISAFLSRYTATRQMHSKIVQERKRKEWFINSLLCCKENDLWGSSSLFFLGNHGIKVTTTHFPLSVCQSAAGWQSAIQTCFLLGEW